MAKRAKTIYLSRDLMSNWVFWSTEKPDFKDGMFFLPDTSNDRLRAFPDVWRELYGVMPDEGELIRIDINIRSKTINRR